MFGIGSPLDFREGEGKLRRSCCGDACCCGNALPDEIAPAESNALLIHSRRFILSLPAKP
jgi:hypothetical protein